MVHLIVLGVIGSASAAPLTPEQAIQRNSASFDRALAKAGLKVIKLEQAPAEISDVAGPEMIILELVTAWSQEEVIFAVDAKGTIVRIRRQPRRVGRVKVSVCHAGPARRSVGRVRFTVPADHRAGGERVVRYPAYQIDEENTCR